MPDTPTLVDIAAAIRRHSPGAVPESVVEGVSKLRWVQHRCIEADGTKSSIVHTLPDDIARHVLIAAMLMDTRPSIRCWGFIVDRCDGKMIPFRYEEHDHDPLLTLYAAWKFTKGIDDD